MSIVKDGLSYPSRIGPNNPYMVDNFVHLLIYLGYLLYKQHVSSIQGIVVNVDMIYVPFLCFQLLIQVIYLFLFFVELHSQHPDFIFLGQ